MAGASTQKKCHLTITSLAMLFTTLCSFAPARIVYVDDDATGANNGSSWADACRCLQNALAYARSGDEIRIAKGTYKPDLRGEINGNGWPTPSPDRQATFQLVNGVVIRGGYAGYGEPVPDARDLDVHETILSGDLNGDDGPNFANNSDNSFHVVDGSGANSTAVLEGVTITAGNAPDGGGGIYNSGGSPTIINCLVGENSARNGGGMFNFGGSTPDITGCTFVGNHAAEEGGAMRNYESAPRLTNCTFIANFVEEKYGGGMRNYKSSPILINCAFIGNSGAGQGGGIFNHNDSHPRLTNCLFSGNVADAGGGLSNVYGSHPTLINCTFSNNQAGLGRGGGIDNVYDARPTLINCILWGNASGGQVNEQAQIHAGTPRIDFCCTQGWTGSLGGSGNHGLDPIFLDSDGLDNIPGTSDDNLRLSRGSVCRDTGDNSAVPPSITTDLGGDPRIVNGTVDMGAYEARSGPFVYYVDAVNGNEDNDGLTLGSAFATIRKAISTAWENDTVLVYPGPYEEEISFLGKKLTIRGVAAGPEGAPTLQNPGDFAVSFHHGEGPESVLKNFIIENSFIGIFIAGSSPTISNLTIVNNKHGIEAYASSDPDISNIIFWNNTGGDLFGCEARYSCSGNAAAGQGNIDSDPLFADPDNGDYHLRSERGRYWPRHDAWILDNVTSPCVDAGDPNVDPFDEPAPNGQLVNMGAYGGTSQASLSPSGQVCLSLGKASDPSPLDGAVAVSTDVVLSWTAGTNAVWHDVYFGTNPTPGSAELVSERQTEPTYRCTENLALGATYYWRIDESDDLATRRGDIWSFTTGDFIAVDDFESYNDIDPPDPASNRIFDVWIDGFGTAHNGALVGDWGWWDWPMIVHSGSQSMPFSYDNNLKISEATRTLVSLRDWTEGGVRRLSLWFHGDEANSAERMFVALNGTAVVYHENTAATQMVGWNEWVIPLQTFADQGVNLVSVNTITIGLGTKNNPTEGGTGKMYFDDIRLYRPVAHEPPY